MKKIVYVYAIVLFSALLAAGTASAQCIIFFAEADADTACVENPIQLRADGQCDDFIVDFNVDDLQLDDIGWDPGSVTTFTIGAPCGPNTIDGSDYLWFGNGAEPRSVRTQPFSICPEAGPCQLCFDMRYGDDDPNPAPDDCEDPDLATEGVFIQFSTDDGLTWTDINYYDPTTIPGGGHTWDTYCVTLPPAALVDGVRFRWFQNLTSGFGFDHWGIDNVSMTCDNAGGATNVSWSHGPTVFNPPPVIPAPGDFYILTIDDGVCNISSDTVFIEVIPNPLGFQAVTEPAAPAGSSNTVRMETENDTIYAGFTGFTPNPNSFYRWYRAEAFPVFFSTDSAVVLTQPGTYILEIQAGAFCNAFDTLTILPPIVEPPVEETPYRPILTGEPGSESAYLSWNAAEEDQNVLEFNIYGFNDTEQPVRLGTTTESNYTVEGLVNDIIYSFAITPVYGTPGSMREEGDYSNVVTIRPSIILGEDSEEDLSFEVFPNPNSGAFTVRLGSESNSSTMNISVFSLTGQLVTEKNINNAAFVQSTRITMPSSAADGLYIVQVETDKGIIREKINLKR